MFSRHGLVLLSDPHTFECHWSVHDEHSTAFLPFLLSDSVRHAGMLGIDRAGASHLCLLVLCLLWRRGDTAWPVSRDLLDGALGHMFLEPHHPPFEMVSVSQAC